MTIACLAIAVLMDGVAPSLVLCVMVPVGALVYGGTLWCFDRDRATELVSLVRRRRSGSSHDTPTDSQEATTIVSRPAEEVGHG